MKLSVSLPNDLVVRLDEARGELVPRSAWLAWAVEAVLDQLAGRQVVLRSEAELQRLRERTLREWEADDRGVEQALEGDPVGARGGADGSAPAPAEPPPERSPEMAAPPRAKGETWDEVLPVGHPARSPVARPHLPTCRCPVCR